eukprot:jgi/Ulvmu1/8355/UM042_0061.1
MPSSTPCCPVSQEPYETEGPNKPRTLPCGHSISHGSLETILAQADAERRFCPIDRTPLAQATADAYPINYAIVEILGAFPAADSHDAPPPRAVADPVVPAFPLAGAPRLAAPAPDLSFGEVLPGGSAHSMSEAVWHRVEDAYKLPRTAVDGSPADWAVLGWTATGNCAYRGLSKSTHGMPSAVALCYAASLTGGDTAAAQAQGDRSSVLRAAVAPHVALQQLPDVRPLLPTLHGYLLTAADAEAGPEAEVGAGGGQDAWLAYSLQGNCLAVHLEQQAQHYMPPKLVVAMFRQLASALEAMHRHSLSTATLYPLSVASVRLDTVHAPSAIRLAPYACEIPATEGPFSSTGAFEALCTPPEGQAGGADDDAAAADVWRAAAVAGVALVGDALLEALQGGAAARPAMLIDSLQRLRSNPTRLPPELADILEGCLNYDPHQRWTAERLHASLLSETLDTVTEPAQQPPPVAPVAQPPTRPAHIVINMPLQTEQPPPRRPPAPGQGQRPTPQTRSCCDSCLAKTCYAIAIFLTVCLIIGAISGFSSS